MKKVILPRLGEGIFEVTLINWLKKEGDYVAKEEAIAEVATDKVDSEILAEEEGYISRLLYKPQDIMRVGEPIAILGEKTESEESAAVVQPINEIDITPEKESDEYDSPSEKSEADSPTQSIPHSSKRAPANKPSRKNKKHSGVLSPLVKKIAQEHKIEEAELADISASGSSGRRITKQDILEHIREKERRPEPTEKAPRKSDTAKEQISSNPPPFKAESESIVASPPLGEGVAMDRVRKLIAARMKSSLNTSAHVTSISEADVSNVVKWKKENAPIAAAEYDTKLSFTPIFLRAVVHALVKYPTMNSSITEDLRVVRHKNFNLGLAVALPNGNLVVPVIKNALSYNLIGLAKECERVAKAAKENTLLPDELKGGTFTVSNIGASGALMGTPIINQPEVAILAIGTIKKRPVAVENNGDYEMAIRDMTYLSLSYDHRLIDGMLGGLFLNEIVRQLEHFSENASLI